jgi:hypothetical protein
MEKITAGLGIGVAYLLIAAQLFNYGFFYTDLHSQYNSYLTVQDLFNSLTTGFFYISIFFLGLYSTFKDVKIVNIRNFIFLTALGLTIWSIILFDTSKTNGGIAFSIAMFYWLIILASAAFLNANNQKKFNTYEAKFIFIAILISPLNIWYGNTIYHNELKQLHLIKYQDKEKINTLQLAALRKLDFGVFGVDKNAQHHFISENNIIEIVCTSCKKNEFHTKAKS